MKMIKHKTILSAATLAIASSASSVVAQTSDHQYDSPYRGMPTTPGSSGYYASPLSDKVYLGFDLGVALPQDITLRDSVGDSEKVSFDPGVRMDLMLGYQINAHWAAELEFGFIANQVKQSYALGTDYMDVTYFQFPLLVNGIYTLPLNRSKSCSVYLGAGVGGVFSQYMNEYNETTPSDSAFAYQGLAGFRWAVNEKWEIGLGYKFLGTTSHDVGSGYSYDGTTYRPTEFTSDGTMTHSILATLTFRF